MYVGDGALSLAPGLSAKHDLGFEVSGRTDVEERYAGAWAAIDKSDFEGSARLIDTLIPLTPKDEKLFYTRAVAYAANSPRLP